MTMQPVDPIQLRKRVIKVITAHAGASTLGEALASWGVFGTTFPPKDSTDWEEQYGDGAGFSLRIENGHKGMLQAYQHGFENTRNQGFGIYCFLHDDLIIKDQSWLDKVMREFEDPTVGMVGFGGSTTHGSDRIYKDPYQIMQLSRGQFLSNMVDAEVHGLRYDGPPIEVAALDGYALIFRRELLEKAGGWPVGKLVFHGYDFWATCMAHRLGYKVKLVPIAIKHYGGMTSVAQKKDDGDNHAKGHEWIYNEFRDCLPWRCS